MATPLADLAHKTQSLGGQAIDGARALPKELPRQLTKTVNYMLGRGFIGVALIAVGAMTSWTMQPAMWVALPLLTGFQAFMDYRKEQNAKHHLLEEFGEEISKTLGKPQKDLTLKDLQTVAEGDPSRGIKPNIVLDEEWDRIGRKRTIQFITTAVSGLGAFMLVQMPLFGGSTIVDLAGNLVAQGQGFAASVLGAESFFGQMVATGFTYTGLTLSAGIILQTANATLDFVTFGALGLSRKTTHDRIDDISKDLERGKLITKEQVLGVFVSANPDLAEDIREAFGKDYDKLGWQKQQAAVAKFGEPYKIYDLAYMLNFKTIKPQELAFAVVGEESGVPKRDQYGRALEQHEQDVAKEQEKQAEKEARKAEGKSFVERFTNGPKPEKQSFLERVSQQELNAAETAITRS